MNPDDQEAQSIFDFHINLASCRLANENDPVWQKDNLEYDLRTSKHMVEKVRASETYAQNLYAAMCNNEFQKNEVMPILTEKTWSCSWRYAGGILADMNGKGGYMDYYCSGIRHPDEKDNLYVGESFVTDEVRQDLFDLGWLVVNNSDNNQF